MRNLKKFLALVLVLVMTMSVMTVAGAAYADADEITSVEAVEVMSAAGIFNGIDGEFQPNGKLTREQAMKIVAYMLLGAKKADALPKDIQPFEDVAAGRWSAGAIAYCASLGIVSGDGTGNFNPTAEVTGYAFGKMVMGAAGIKGQFTGEGWEFNVALALDEYKLLNGLEGVVLSQSLTREQACQLAFNALNYTKGGKATGEYKVVAKTENAAAVAMNGEVFADRVDAIVTMNALDDTIELGVDYDLIAVTDNAGSLAKDVHGITCIENYPDDFGVESLVWFNAKGDPIYVEEEEAFLKFANKTMTSGDLHTALGLAKNKSVTGTLYTDGAESTFSVVRKGTEAVGGNGVETAVYWNGYTLSIVEVSTFVGTVENVYEAVKADEAKDIEAVPAKVDILVGETLFEGVETEAYEEDEVVLVTIAAGKVQSHEAAEAVVGTVDKYVSEKTVTVNGTTYKKADNAVAMMPGADVAFDVPHVYYTDGVNVYAVAEVDNAPTTSVDGHVYVLGWQIAYAGGANADLYGDAVASSASAKAKVVNLDGSIEVVDLAVTYNKQDKHFYVADPVTGEATKITEKQAYTQVNAWAAYELVDGEISFLGDAGESFTANKQVKVGKYTLTAKTAYTYINVADGVVKTVTGYKNIVVDSEALVVADKNGIVSNIYVVKTTEDEVPDTYANLAYVVEKGASYAAGTEYTVYVDGLADTKIFACEVTEGAVYNLTINEKGVVTAVEKVLEVKNGTAVEVSLVDEDYFIAGGEVVFFDKDCETFNAKTGAADTIEAKDKVVYVDLDADLDVDLIYVVG